MARTGIVGKDIHLKVKFLSNGTLFDPFDVQDVKIFASSTSTTVLATLPVVRLSVGLYEVVYDVPLSFSEGTYYDEWTWTAEEGMSSNTQRYSFYLTLEGASAGAGVPESEAATAHVSCRSRPTWLSLEGLRDVEDVGNGIGLKLTWLQAIPTSPLYQIHYNIYKADTRFGLLDSDPVAITTERQVVISAPPSNLQYLMVRALEFKPSEFEIASMTQIGNNVYKYPSAQVLQSSIDAYSTTIEVEDNSEFPEKGFLLIGHEVIRYSSKNNATQFYVENDDRGQFITTPTQHYAGDAVKLFKGVEDGNSNMFMQAATWQYDESRGTPRNIDAIGEFNVDGDGYRSIADTITTDLSASDANTEDFPHYDFKGYHRPSLYDTFSGKCVGSYFGGEFNGQRGFNLQDRSLAQLDAMLQVTGEPVILLRRKTSGKTCHCVTPRREQPRFRCPSCYGTQFENGYDRFINNKAISEAYPNSQGMILVRVAPFTDDLKLEQSQGFVQPVELTAWTITYPAIKDRDVIIRLNEDFSEEYRYEVLQVNRNKLFFSQSGKQEFQMRRMDKTDVIYLYDATI